MKKIVGIFAAAAVAASVFAVDIAANVHGWTDLFYYDLTTEGAKPKFLGVRDPFDRKFAWSSTGIGFSVAGDQAGASFELDGRDVAVENVKFWVKPFDALKVTVGKVGLASNCETIDYTKMSAYEDGREGWAIDLTPVDGLSINAMLVTGAARSWVWKYWGENGKIGETVGKISYSADFGSIFAMVNYTDPATEITAGYSGNFDALSLFADVAFNLDSKNLGADVFVSGSADALGYKVYAKYARNLDAATQSLLAKVLVTYGLESGTAYFKAVLPDALADEFAMQIYPGYQFNIGAASIDAGVQFNLKTDLDANTVAKQVSDGNPVVTNIRVPVIYKIAF